MILVFYINNYHEKYDQVLLNSFSFSAFKKSTVKKYMGIFFFYIWETIGGWDNLLIVMVRPLEFFFSNI